MSTITGKIESKSRNGSGIKVQGNWYNGSTSTLSAVEWKDEITMEVDGKNITSISKVGGGGEAGGQSSQGGGVDNRQACIIYQNSRTAAVTVAAALATSDLIPLPAGKEKKHDAFMEFVDALTDRYFDEAVFVQNTGDVPSRESE